VNRISWVVGLTLLAMANAQGQSLLTISPAPNPKALAPDGLYLVNVTCRVSPPPEQKVNVLEKKIRESAFTITLSTSRVGINQAPPANSVLAAIPVFASTIGTSPPPSTFKNSGCNQSLLITGLTPLYLTAVWSDQQSFEPSELTNAIGALAGLVAPLGVLFPTGPANLIKTDTSIANAVSGPFAQLIKATNWSSTQTETTSELKETTYTVSATYFTKRVGGGTTSPAANISISIKQIASIKAALSIPTIGSAFEAALRDFADQVRRDSTTCIAIGRALELNQKLTHADAVYALARVVLYSGIPSDKVATCLGRTYGPEVIKESFWKQNSHMTLTDADFRETQDVPPPFSPVVFDSIASAMLNYADDRHNNVELDRYFAQSLELQDSTSLVGSGSNLTIEQILDKLKSAAPSYLYYGCSKGDTSSDFHGIPAVAYMLVIDRSLKPENMMIMRAWWRLPTQGTTHLPEIYQLSLGYEGDLVKTTLSTFNNQCGRVKIPES
jgi:hypothetical protein